MLSIGKFFERIQNVRTKELFVRTVVKDAVKKHIGIDIPVEDINIKSDWISFKGLSGAARSALYIKKTVLLGEINSNQTIKAIKDLR